MRYPSLAHEDLLGCLQLLRTHGIGAVGFFQQFTKAGSIEQALRTVSASKNLPSIADIKKELHSITQLGARILRYGEPDYPTGLTELYDAPPLLTCLGDPSPINSMPLVAIVGARHASKAGEKLANQFAEQLISAGYGLVSGLARGIDAAAHYGALNANGYSMGISAVGIDQVYPPQHRQLYEQMAQQGCILTEYAPTTTANPRHFPARNRIIAGMSQATIVIEASQRSGSRITARCALDYGREVLAVPGAAGDARSRGCNLLIQEGAALVDCPSDIFNELQGLATPTHTAPTTIVATTNTTSTTPTTPILSALSKTPISVDELCQHIGMTPASLSPLLLEHELSGSIIRHAGNKVSLS